MQTNVFVGAAMGFGACAMGQVLVNEGFEGLQLQDAVSASEQSGRNVWSDQVPTGWSVSTGSTPNNGPTEFFGWRGMRKDWWVATEGDQSRSLFTRGSGVVMVADPDAFDDAPGTTIEPNLFESFLSVTIDLTGVSGDELVIDFDSSFRPYDTMRAGVSVSFDGGAADELLFLDNTNVPGGDSSLARIDERVSLSSAIARGASSVTVSWNITLAGNDWWWAIDNVTITAVPAPAAAAVFGVMGVAAGRRRR